MNESRAATLTPVDSTERGTNPLAARYGEQKQTIRADCLVESGARNDSHPSFDPQVRRTAAAGRSDRASRRAAAPSSSNLQAFSIVAVEDKGRKARLAKFAADQRHVEEAPLLLMFVADLARLRQIAAANGDACDGLDYTESFLIALTDAAFAAQNCLIALESIGLGGCYIGAMRNHPREVAEEIGLPPGAFVVFGMTIGYPDPNVETGIKPRLPQSIVLHRERYAPPAPADLAAYDEALRAFRVRSIDVRHRVKQAGDRTGPWTGIADGPACAA